MPSRHRDPRDLSDETFDPGITPRRTPAYGRSEPFQKRSSPQRLPSFGHTDPFLRRFTAPRLPSFDPSATFHTRATPPRVPALGQPELDEDGYPQQGLSEDDFWFIAGPRQPGAWRPVRRKAYLSVKLLTRLALLPMALLLLLGAQGFISNLARDCGGAQAQQRQQSCFVMSLFPEVPGSAATHPVATSIPTRPMIPAVPDDLPANVHDFVVIALPYAIQAHKALAWPTSVILAQWGLEHGWKVPDYTGYNWGNSSAIEGEPSVPGTNAPGSPAAFAYARTPADGLRYFLSAARLPYYAGVAPAAKRGGANAAAVALGESPWDAAHYTVTGHPGSSLLAIMQDFNFYRFDVGG